MQYVRLTFKPAGAARRRTVWAKRLSKMNNNGPFAGATAFSRINKYGEEPDDKTEFILVNLDKDDAKVVPARMNLHYGMLELEE